MNVSLVSVSPDAEKHMAYCARVSNPNNQENDNYAGLLRYCIKHQHWSIFEQAFMTLEINTTRGLAAQNIKASLFYISRIFTKICGYKFIRYKYTFTRIKKTRYKESSE